MLPKTFLRTLTIKSFVYMGYVYINLPQENSKQKTEKYLTQNNNKKQEMSTNLF
jgi:hypothetical protein